MIKNSNIYFCFRCYHTWNKRKEDHPKWCPSCKSPYWNKPRTKISKEVVTKMEEMVINIHNTIITISGGEKGIREKGGVYNSTYKLLNYQARHHNDPCSVGSFILNEFAKRHHFIDGNKRTAYVLAKIFMLINKCHLQIEFDDATDFILNVAKYESKFTFEEIKQWLEDNCRYIEEKDVENYLNKIFTNLVLRGENNE